MKIVIDAYGGDNAPYEIVKGAVMAIKMFEDLEVVLVGDSQPIEDLLEDFCVLQNNRISIIHASDVITNDDVPTLAIRQKKESSLVKAFDALKDDSICGLISAGSTGAVLTASILKIGRIKGVSRPALCPLLPTEKGPGVLLVDCGANVDCKPVNLVHFAIMGSEYYKSMLGVENPKVALLNIGTEDKKGNELTKAVFPLLKEAPINFVGNVEARDFINGEYDVVVTDGFYGNILLKGVEGTLMLFAKELKSHIKKHFFSRIGSIFMLKTFRHIKNRFDYNKYGGSPFVGTKKLVVKAHGSSNSVAILASIKQIIKLNENNYIKSVEENISKHNLEVVEANE